MEILTDEDVRRIVTPSRARAWMHEALLAAGRGDFSNPARVAVELVGGRLTFTCGELPAGWFGYRSYLAPGSAGDEQVTVLHQPDGRVSAIAVGVELGPRRVGAIGGVAAEALAPSNVAKVALLGSGTQAWYQLWGLPDRLRSAAIAVHSPHPEHRDRFAGRVRDELGLSATAYASAKAAVEDAQVVILATASANPVVDVRHLEAGAYVTAVGPKQVGRAEFDATLAAWATLLVTDSITQIRNYDPPHVLADTPHFHRIVGLGNILACQDRVGDGPRVFFSVGLAGTEVFLLSRALRSHDGDTKGGGCD